MQETEQLRKFLHYFVMHPLTLSRQLTSSVDGKQKQTLKLHRFKVCPSFNVKFKSSSNFTLQLVAKITEDYDQTHYQMERQNLVL